MRDHAVTTRGAVHWPVRREHLRAELTPHAPAPVAVGVSFHADRGGLARAVHVSHRQYRTRHHNALVTVEFTDRASPVVVFGPFPGDAPVCIKEVVTPAGYTVLHSDFACLHLGCADQFLWDFRPRP